MSDDKSTLAVDFSLNLDDPKVSTTDASRNTKKDEMMMPSSSYRSSHRGSLPRRTELLRSGTMRLSQTILEDINHLIEKSKYDDAIHKCFEAMDTNHSGQLERDELFVFLKEATARLQLDVEDDVIHLAINALMESIHATNVGNTAVPAEISDIITREQFFQMFQNNPDLYTVFESRESLILKKKSSTLTLSIKDTPKEEEAKETEELWKHAHAGWKNYGIFVIWLALYIAATVSMFISTAFRWANDDEALAVFGNCIIIARSCAAALNLHACLILLPISRHTLTLLRLSWARFLFPFDVSLEVHMMLGWVFGIFAATHTLAHVCDYVRLVDADQADLEALLGHALPDIPESKSGRLKLMLKQPATITGVIMVLCLVLAYAVVFSRRKHFNRFWYLHHLLIIMLIMMCVHGTGNLLQPFQSVYWICGPLALYIIPRIYREINCRPLKVLGVNIHEDVVGLKVEKPPGWDRVQRAGMYAFINVPAVSKWEWHPFTISSSPFQSHLGFHIKTAGDWTTQLHRLMSEKKLESENTQDSFRKVSEIEQTSTAVYIEGPIGASSQGFSDHESVVLIGAGIGVTPMVSVIRQLLVQPGKMRRVFFFWTVRDSSSFEWFNKLMEEIYEQDAKHVLEVRHFLTSAKQKDDRDIGAVLFHYAANAIHTDTSLDVVLGHRSRHQVQVGRPDWDMELNHVVQITKEMGENDCGVFLCGPEVMAVAVAETCTRLSLQEPDFHLYFAKETF